MSEDQKAVFSRAPEIFKKLRGEIDKVIVGQNVAIEQLLVAILAGGHDGIDDFGQRFSMLSVGCLFDPALIRRFFLIWRRFHRNNLP